MDDKRRKNQRRGLLWGALCGLVCFCGSPAWGFAAPSPGKHPYFSKHPAAWKKLVDALRKTRQLKPMVPRRFPLSRLRSTDFRKRPYALSRHRGEVVLLTRWATWCKSCKYDLKAKRKLARAVKVVPVAIVGVTHEPFSLVSRYHKRAPAAEKFAISLVDPRGMLARYFRGMSYPATALIDPWGWIVADRVGPGLWVTPAYHKLFGLLSKLAPQAWKSLPSQRLYCAPRRR